jgi:sigma-B regulation protein RsbQ
MFEADHRVISFDYVGAGSSDITAYDSQRYSSLSGYADDVVEICRALDLHDVVFVGHSVSAMIGALVAIDQPDLFAKLVMVGPSPRYINVDDYVGGFAEEDIADLLASLESNYLGWSSAIAPAIMGNPDRPALGAELTESFCRTDPEVARQFAHVTFMSDNRADLTEVKVPTLVLQCREDIIAGMEVGRYVQRALPDAEFVVLDATGHCPHLSAPEQTAAAIAAFLRR